MSNEELIKVEQVSKKFCRGFKRSLWYGLNDMADEVLGRNDEDCGLRKDEFWAIKDVSFELRRGECLGLIGRNGAGKTTLLKMLNGLIKPDRGRITMRGRVGALIALGAGFNPILTGRENIYVNASVLGLTKREVNVKIDEIIDFSEIREFIDAPVQSYSSGMAVRLGFAVASSLSPTILLIDEVLAVGDAKFRTKCYDRIDQLRKNAAIILVSHNKQDILRICTESILLDRGQLITRDDAVSAFAVYDTHEANSRSFVHAWPGLELVLARIEPDKLTWNAPARLRLVLRALREFSGLTIRLTVLDNADMCVAEWRSEHHMKPINLQAGNHDLIFDFGPVKIQSGAYPCNIVISQPPQAQYVLHAFHHFTLQVEGNMRGFSPYQI